MKKIILISCLLLLAGAGCSLQDDQSGIVEDQQKQIDELTKKIEEISQSEEIEEEQIETENDKGSSQSPVSAVSPSPQVKIIKETIIKEVETKEEPKEDVVAKEQVIKTLEDLVVNNIQAIPTVNNVVFRWSTNKPSTGYVTIWPVSTADGTFKSSSFVKKEKHEVYSYLRLVSGKEYSYSITAESESGESATTEERKFTTPEDKVAPIVIISPGYIAAGKSIFYIKSNEYATTYVSWYLDDERNKQQTSYVLEEPGKFYSISLSHAGYMEYISKIYIKVDGYDDDSNYSTTGWFSYVMGEDIKK